MSAPENDELLEAYAEDILGMSEIEMLNFCKLTLEDHGYTVTLGPDPLDPNSQMTDYQRFKHDMGVAGFNVQEYRGRFGWKGPCVMTDENGHPTLHEVQAATKVKLQRDNMGFHFVVYPAAREDSWK